MQKTHLNLVEDDDDMDSCPPPIPIRSHTPRRQVTMKQRYVVMSQIQPCSAGLASHDKKSNKKKEK
ncbi:hypothetical protein EDB82DRAFT_498072 [Fusarium venenatum]|uniref:uncharacterized protein n=1 Tax=Fusarium venenatum TaxID=56646 RepID=UPI001D46CD48|nr:hypothetical protein EDB82DRAFT_498072 [Fusarium venenatum]